ncbi:efflux RND transporter periplasmic adaptor subunit [Rhodopirellula sallentina]|uniref:RND family efflux transporter MFP subunit n=1 Tax=Rhodopirellula sallentina SM41 TaxID=1263870 RepID=M5TW16_9BACT|nr:RND family efflux transporter MFP subunit [Rhodopirellula sallentina]EMI53219.1 RND family efflux transporter MFP subunit [Rhodopirellula sallentina SM41]
MMANPGPDKTMKRLLSRWGKRLLIVPPIVLAVVALIYLTQTRPPPKIKTESEAPRALSVIAAPEMEIQPRAVGFGTAEFAKKWRAVAQVSGRIQEVHPELRPGAIIGANDLLLKIDDADYRSAVAELTALMEQKEAEISQLEQTRSNYDKTLELERAALTLLDRELKRLESLMARQAESQSTIDSTRRSYIAQQNVVQDLENSKSLIDPQIQVLQAGVRQTAAQLEKAKRDVERTEIRAPFTMRIGEVDLELDQFVAINETLFEGYSDAEMEIEVQISTTDIPRLLAAPPTGQPPPEEQTMELMREVFRVTPTVEISGGESNAVYEGQFLRVREVVDSQTRQVGVVIGVTNKPKVANGRPRPPVLEGSFCKVTLRGEPIGSRVVVPRMSLHGDSVYVLDEESRLATRKVEVEFFQDGVAVLASGLSPGELIIVADPSPAVAGSLIEPVNDEESLQLLKDAVQ